MRFVAFILMTFLPGFVSQGVAQSQYLIVPVNMTLDTPAASGNGINNLRFNLTINATGGPYTGQDDVKTLVATSSGVTSFLVEVNPTTGLIVRGMKHNSGTSDSEDMSITCTPNSLLGTIKVTGTGLGGSPQTPSGLFEAVTATVTGGTYVASLHNTRFNKGTIVTKVGSNTQDTRNLGSNPLVYPGTGTGIITVTENPALKDGFKRTYSIKVSQPLDSSQPVDSGSYTGSMRVRGSVVGTGSVQVEVKPALEVLGPVVGGTEVKIKGIIGEQAKLMAGDTPSAMTRMVGSYTLTAAETTVLDTGANGKARQFYTVVPGP